MRVYLISWYNFSALFFNANVGTTLAWIRPDSLHNWHKTHKKEVMEHPRYQKDCLIFGCGNPLFGDDGFGPAVIEYLETECTLPENITALDVGTSIRDILFDIILSEQKPRRMIIVDAVDFPDRLPGEIFEIDVDEIAPAKIGDYSLHQFPTTNMLKEIREQTQIDVRLLVVQITGLPSEVRPGLSAELLQAIPAMSGRILELAALQPAEGSPS